MYTKKQILEILDQKIVGSIPFLYEEYRHPMKLKRHYRELLKDILFVLNNHNVLLLTSGDSSGKDEKGLSEDVIYADQKYVDHIIEGITRLLDRVEEIEGLNNQESYHNWLKGEIMGEIYIFLNIYAKELI